jgi:hypothetical protein
MPKETHVLHCTVRYYGATYIASGEKIRASCTSAPEQAAKAWALKTILRNLGSRAEGATISVRQTSESSVHEVPVQYRCEVVA